MASKWLRWRAMTVLFRSLSAMAMRRQAMSIALALMAILTVLSGRITAYQWDSYHSDIEITSPRDGSALAGVNAIRGRVLTESDLERVELYVDNTFQWAMPAKKEFSAFFDAAMFPSGWHEMKFRAIRATGRFTETRMSIFFEEPTAEAASVLVRDAWMDGRRYDLRLDQDPASGEFVIGKVLPAVTPPKFTIEPVSGYANTYKVTIDLKAGAELKTVRGSGPQGSGFAACRGWANKFGEFNLAGFAKATSTSTASVLISGSFHDDEGMPAFPLRSNGWTATYGYECRPEYGSQDLMMLTIRNSEHRAYIAPFNLATFNSSTIAPEVVVGLKTTFSKASSSKRGRNFVGLKDPYNGGYGTVVFVISKDPEIGGRGLTQAEAEAILKNAGCVTGQIMMLDGSTVAQLSKKESGVWNHLITSSREMPQAFAVY